MICDKCKKETFDNSTSCINCGAIIESNVPKEKNEIWNEERGDNNFNTHMTKAILVTIFGFSILGFIAVYFSYSAKNKLKNESFKEAKLLANRANICANIGIALVPIIYVIAILYAQF